MGHLATLLDGLDDGRLWAIQAKHYGPDRRITKGDVNSFLAEAGRYGFDFLLLITSGSGVSDRHARGTLADHGVGVRESPSNPGWLNPYGLARARVCGRTRRGL